MPSKIQMNLSESKKNELASDYCEWLLNDYESYKNQRECIEKSLHKKMAKGDYNHTLAIKTFYHLAYGNKKRFILVINNNNVYKHRYGEIDNISKDVIEKTATYLTNQFE
jgi:hypothetical protein